MEHGQITEGVAPTIMTDYPLKYAGKTPLTSEDKVYTRRLMKKFQPEKFSSSQKRLKK